jgi:NitT/TauT family transport system substrate-binding protein
MHARSRFLATVAAGTAGSARPVRAQTLPQLRAGTVGDDEATPFVYGVARGLFRSAGVDVSTQRAPNGAAVVAGVLGGSFDIGKSSLIALFAAHLRGLPIVLIAPGSEYNADEPVVGTVVRSDVPWRTGADLNGKILAVSSINDFLAVAVRTWVDAHGGDSSTLKLIEIPMSASPAAVESGRVDIAAVTGPFLRSALDTGKLRLFTHPPDAIAPHFLISAWFSTTDLVSRRGDDLRRFLRVMRDAAAYCNDHHGETVAMVSRFMGMDPHELATGIRSTLGVTLDTRKIQPLIDAAARMKAISAPFDARDLIAGVAVR